MSNPGKVKLFQAASGQTGSSRAAAGGANVSFPDALQEANASTSHSFSNNSTHASGYSSGHTKTGQGEELKKGSTKNGAAEGQSGAQAGYQVCSQVIQQAGKQAGTDAASQAGEGGQSGLAGTKKLSSKVDVDGSKDDLRAHTKDNGASQSSGQTASKGSLDADIAGIIGSLVASGSLAPGGGETKTASSALSGTGTSGAAKAAGADAMSGTSAAKKSGIASGQKNTKKTLADALQATGVSQGAGTASGVDKKDGKSGQLADSLVPGPRGGSPRADSDLAAAINSAAGSVPESDQSGQSAGVADKSKAGEGGADESGHVSGKSSAKAPLSDPGKTDGKKLFAQAQVDDGKNKFSADLKTKVDETVKIKGQEGPGDKAAPGGQEESSHSQNGLSGSRPDNTSNNLAAQDLLKAGAQESGAAQGKKFILAQVIAAAKNVQAGVLKDVDKGKGQAIDGRSIQTPDKSVSVSTGNSNPANIISGRTQTETVRTPHPVEEPFVVTKQADNSIEVRIEPEGLGKMDIKLYMDKGQLNAHINASESIGKEVIEGHLENIANKLAGEGINIGSFSVSLRNRKNGGQREFFPGNGDRSGDKTRTMQIEQIGQKPAVAGGGLLSLFA